MTSPGRAMHWGQVLTLLVTNAIKIAGLVIAIRTAFASKQPAAEFALSAFMLAGAQLSEETILKLWDHMFRPDDPSPPQITVIQTPPPREQTP